MKELEEMKKAFDNLTKSALKLNEMYKRKSKIIEEKDKEIERLKEEYVMLQNASDEVEEEKDKEIERLNNIIKRLEEDLREMYLTFGEFSEEYTENRIRELKGEDKE